MGNNPRRSSRVANSSIAGMTFLNRQFPAERDGEISTWNYCYYGDIPEDTYTATVAVWRYNNVTEQYTVVNGSISILEVVHVARPYLSAIYCEQESLAADGYVTVKVGDIIGVSLPPSNPIPLVGNTCESSCEIWQTSGPVPSSISTNDIASLSKSLHLYADIATAIGKSMHDVAIRHYYHYPRYTMTFNFRGWGMSENKKIPAIAY